MHTENKFVRMEENNIYLLATSMYMYVHMYMVLCLSHDLKQCSVKSHPLLLLHDNIRLETYHTQYCTSFNYTILQRASLSIMPNYIIVPPFVCVHHRREANMITQRKSLGGYTMYLSVWSGRCACFFR